MSLKIPCYILLCSLLGGCKQPESLDSPEETMLKVETSLMPPVHFLGDSIWTLENRIKHYGVATDSLNSKGL